MGSTPVEGTKKLEYCQVVKALAFDANIPRFKSLYSKILISTKKEWNSSVVEQWNHNPCRVSSNLTSTIFGG